MFQLPAPCPLGCDPQPDSAVITPILPIVLVAVSLAINGSHPLQGQATEARTVWLDELDVSLSSCGWNSTRKNRSVDGNPLRLGGVEYRRGIGTHTPGEFRIQLDGGSSRFTAEVGIDDEVGDLGTAVFKVIGDEQVLWQSGVLAGSDEARNVDVDLTGVQTLRLVVTMAGDGYGHDHTDWADARIEVTGEAPRALRVDAAVAAGFADLSGVAAVTGATAERLAEDWALQHEESQPRSYGFPLDQALDQQSLLLASDSRTPTEVAVRRLEALIERLGELPTSPDLEGVEQRFAALKKATPGSPEEELAHYLELRRVGRQAVLANPLLDFDSILFVSRGVLNDHHQRKSEYDGDHFCDQYYGHNGRRGGGLFILENWKSATPVVIDVVEGLVVPSGTNAGKPMSEGTSLAPDLSWDGETIVFAWSSGGQEKWNPENRFNVFKVDVDGTGLKRLTDGDFDDIDPCWLPDGRVVFLSTRRGGFGRCHGRPVPTFTMFSMKADGTDRYCIDYHETNEFHPSVNNDGMIVYTRWDYVDRDHSAAHHLWQCFPDGRDPRSYHGNYALPLTTVEGNDWKRGLLLRPWAEFNCRGIPGSHKYIATAGPHHGQAFGSLVLIDTTVADDNQMSQVRRITPGTPFPESETGTRDWNDMAWGTAWPLSEELYLCNYRDTVCILDAFGNRELVCKTLNGMRPIDPIPLRPRKRAPAIPCGTFQGERRTPDAPGATIGIMDVYITDDYGALPPDVRIEQLRVVQLIPKSTPRANDPRIGFGDQSLARIPLGVVPVEEDGSVYFQAPVGKAIYFELLDEHGMAVQSMRSATYVHPGEQMTCVGCHEDKRRTPEVRGTPLAMKRAPSELLPEIPDQVMFHFNRQVRPILESKCASCHRARDAAGPKEVAYDRLEPYVHYRGHGYLQPEHGGSRTRPGKFGARFSRMGQALLNRDHRLYLEEGRFSEQDVRTIAMWLDLNSNELSAYEGVEAQRAGEVVWPALDVDPENITGVERPESER